MVLSVAASAFSRKSRLPLSSTIQMVTSTFCFLASASAAATIVLIAARFRYFRAGRSADDVAATDDAVAARLSITKSSLNMRRMLPVGLVVFQQEPRALDFRLLFAIAASPMPFGDTQTSAAVD